jgi:hypothetical protein
MGARPDPSSAGHSLLEQRNAAAYCWPGSFEIRGLLASERSRARWNRGVTAPTFLVSNMSKGRAAGGGECMPYGIVGIVVIVILVIVVLQFL